MENDKFLIEGLAGEKKLCGAIGVRGAKNAALKIFAASLLFKDKDGIQIDNVPSIEDISRMKELLQNLGAGVRQVAPGSFRIKSPTSIKTDLCDDISKKFRSSIVLTGPILAREGRVFFPHPGGCVIGERPIDIFLESFKKMGASVKTADRRYQIVAKKLHGAEIVFRIPSVTATETLMMAASLVPGSTILHNAACEPEIAALANFLNASGADIRGAGTHTIEIRGVLSLRARESFRTPSDRIEAASFAILAAACGRDIEITDCRPEHFKVLLRILKSAGANIAEKKNSLRVRAAKKLKAVDIKTHEYPGIPTDIQPPLAVLMTQASGRSLIFETIFEGRLNYLNDLARMGADIAICDPHRAIITGPTALRAREMESPDLRAGLAFIIASLIAKGKSVIHNVYNIDRGYEKIEERLQKLGAGIKRI